MKLSLAVVVLLTLVSPARAQSAIDAAHEHARKAEDAYAVGMYSIALKEYRAAYDRVPDPAFLFDIAQSYRLNDEFDAATVYYEKYLLACTFSSCQQETTARQQLDLLKRAVAEARKNLPVGGTPSTYAGESARVELTAVPPVSPPPDRHPLRWLAGGAAVAVVTAVVVTAVVLSSGSSNHASPASALGNQRVF
jgi:alkanesulfonate monooxygenase SsuD/methylene tetrahydromethanopterin reductase-like flavin-dependent oxidoreductase (luciferase family)